MEVRGRAARVALAVTLVAAVGASAFPGVDAQQARFERDLCDPAGGSGGCPGGLHHNGSRTCYEDGRRVCLIHEMPEEVVRVDPEAECVDPRSPHAPDEDPAITVRTPATNVTICVGADPSPQIPGVGFEPPDAGDLGGTYVRSCSRGHGATAVVAGVGATLCVEVEVGDDGDDLAVDLTPCPGGTDPRIDVAGQRVTICIIVGTTENLPDPDAGDVDIPEPYQLLPRTRDPCRSPAGAQVEVIDASATFCLTVGPADTPRSRDCDNGTGVTTAWGGWRLGGCMQSPPDLQVPKPVIGDPAR